MTHVDQHSASAPHDEDVEEHHQPLEAIPHPDQILDNARKFGRIVRIAIDRARAARYLTAAEWCRVASAYAMTNPTGFLRSGDLESAIGIVADGALAPSRRPAKAAAGPRRVMHVITEAAPIGGLTRLAERWMQRDRISISAVVVTRQDEVLERLAEAACASGGSATALAVAGSNVLERAARLRQLAADVDFVICHLHSDDIVTALAFGHGYSGAPVAIYNHADHLFWLAPSNATTIVDARNVGRRLTIHARGYSPELTYLLPLPVPAMRGGADEARLSIGWGFPADSIVAVSVARAIKFRDTTLEPSFSRLLGMALEANPRLAFCAVGPEATDPPWPDLIERYGQRIYVTGPVPDPLPYLTAADIYLDPFPFSSTTSLLEAAAASLPTLTLDAHRDYCRAFGLADFVESIDDRPTTVHAYLQRLQDLVNTPSLRRLTGERARAGYLGLTAPEPWLESLGELYRHLDRASARRNLLGGSAPAEPDKRLLVHAAALTAIEQNIPLLWTVMAGVPCFDARDRRQLAPRIIVTRALQKLRLSPPSNATPRDSLLLPRR
ncbi:hypothetical protein GCM10022236_43500 [Microlunatus ginsengisoli]|uniref:Glycosyltransferase n=1 Tax=Microlunatus ginsengisoli TaxID=363863 RepID=A0ABP7AMN7_9ACTN